MLDQHLTLPCGVQIKNLLCKAAMTEGLATAQGIPTEALQRLYSVWSDSGAGILLSGNVQIDADHLERPGNVVIDKEPDDEMRAALTAWTQAGTQHGNHFWAQISHAGRQTQKMINPHPKAPSAIKLGLPGGQFGEPVAMTEADIEAVISGFVLCARVCKDVGFTGVQIHAAHGYLISQFLSPRSNQRDDQWGGSLENRARLLLSIVRKVRSAVGPDFPISVKLNSADFQRGGFEFTDSLQVAQWLEAASVDLLEISGGTYEQPKLLNMEGLEPVEEQAIAASTRAREAYFVDFAQAMHKQVNIPLMVTGGLRQKAAMDEALASGSADVIGIGRPMCVMTDAPKKLLDGLEELPRYENELSLLPQWLKGLEYFGLIRTLATFATQYWYYEQIALIGRTGAASNDLSVFSATKQQMREASMLATARKKSA